MTDIPENHVFPKSRAEWRTWLQENHSQDDGIWHIRYKKGANKPDETMRVDEIVKEALAFGWIDSLPRKLDDERTMLYIAPRKKGSNWSRLNKKYIAELIADGLMTDAGMAKIKAAKEDGSWSALDAVEQLIVPDDLAAKFDEYPHSREHWDNFPPSVRRSILEWILNAKRDTTRQKRITETARLAADNIRANQWRQ